MEGRLAVKRIKIVRVTSSDGELHYVFEEAKTDDVSKSAQGLNRAEAKKLTKIEASKPLLILRE